MASNYSVYGAKFNPFTYEEIARPLIEQTKEHNLISEELTKLQVQADVWKNRADEQKDPEAYNQYMKYANDLQAAANDLAMNGLSRSTRPVLMNMYRRYASEIVPLQDAYTKMAADREAVRLAREKDNTYMVSYGNNAPTLDTYLKNPYYKYSTASGENMLKQVAYVAQNLKDSNPGIVRQVNDKILEISNRSGYSIDEIFSLIQDPETMKAQFPELYDIVSTVVEKNMSSPDWSQEQKNEAFHYAAQGLYPAFNKTDYRYMNDPEWQYNMSKEEEESQLPMLQTTYFRNVPHVDVQGYKSSELEEMKKVLYEYKDSENPLEAYRQAMIDYKGNPNNYHTGDFGETWKYDKAKKEKERYQKMDELELKKDFIKTYLDKFKDARIKLDSEDITEDMSMNDIIDMIEGFIKSNAILTYDYVLQMPKPDQFINFIVDANLGVDKDNRRNQRSAYIRYADSGKLNNEGVKHKNRTEYIPKEGESISISFSPLEGEFVYTIRDDEGNSRRFYMSPELFGNQLLTAAMSTYKDVLEAGDYGELSRLITGYTDGTGVSHQGVLAMFQNLVNDHLKSKSATGDTDPEYVVDMAYLLGQQ